MASAAGTEFEVAFSKTALGIIAHAATAGVQTAGNNLKTRARADIAAAGFSKKWQNAFRVNFYPKGEESIDAAAFAFHKIPYSGIFETGGRISGSPMLWLPLPNVPRLGRSKGSARGLIDQGVKLFTIKIRGEPYLAANVRMKKGATFPDKLSVAQLRAGNRKLNKKSRQTQFLKAVPLFHGLRSVNIRRRFNIAALANSERAALPGYYAANVEKS